ncbi:hypothetical protein BASA81_000198 [Batrachochytrium salamandrivorans]|nr:hypothetical protein BASA81_000198 [Batrachochytrium salamandrivorans]
MSAITSLKVFREFLFILPDGSIDASRVHSAECYQKWLQARNTEADDNEARKFHRSLSNHLSGVDGRSPFAKREEEAVLKILRKKKRWPCFADQPHLNFGQVGYRSRGFHEKNAAESGALPLKVEEEEADPSKRVKLEPSSQFPSPSSPQQSVLEIQDDDDEEKDLANDATEYIQRMMNHYMAFLSSFAELTFQVWESMMGILRMVLLARSSACAVSLPESYAQELLVKAQAKLPENRYVCIYSLFVNNHNKRVLAQNEASYEYYGDLSHLDKMMLHPSEAPRMLLALLKALHQPGKVMRIPRLLVVGNRLVDSEIYMDPHSCYIVSTGVWAGTG